MPSSTDCSASRTSRHPESVTTSSAAARTRSASAGRASTQNNVTVRWAATRVRSGSVTSPASVISSASTASSGGIPSSASHSAKRGRHTAARRDGCAGETLGQLRVDVRRAPCCANEQLSVVCEVGVEHEGRPGARCPRPACHRCRERGGDTPRRNGPIRPQRVRSNSPYSGWLRRAWSRRPSVYTSSLPVLRTARRP